jgi:hypothetical protein
MTASIGVRPPPPSGRSRSLTSSIWRFSKPFAWTPSRFWDYPFLGTSTPQFGDQILKRNVPTSLSGRRSAYFRRYCQRFQKGGIQKLAGSLLCRGVDFEFFANCTRRSIDRVRLAPKLRGRDRVDASSICYCLPSLFLGSAQSHREEPWNCWRSGFNLGHEGQIRTVPVYDQTPIRF